MEIAYIYGVVYPWVKGWVEKRKKRKRKENL
jgi:hypothetical protein